jgi:hypothetical protein
MAHKGGCFCGEVRYSIEGSPLRVMHCHCTICRRISAAPMVTWISFPVTAFRWTKGEPGELRSTPNALRHFCRKCGTHMVFTIDGAREFDLTLATLDEADKFEPQYNIFNDTRMRWITQVDQLPKYNDWGPEMP